MWTETSAGREIITEFSKDVVSKVANEELPLFDEMVEEYYQDPAPPDLTHQASDDPLGSGLESTLIALTPAAMAMVSAIVTYVLTEVLQAVQEESVQAISKKIKEFFNPKKPQPITKEQLKTIWDVAYKKAREYGAKRDEAIQMADAMVGRIAVAK